MNVTNWRVWALRPNTSEVIVIDSSEAGFCTCPDTILALSMYDSDEEKTRSVIGAAVYFQGYEKDCDKVAMGSFLDKPHRVPNYFRRAVVKSGVEYANFTSEIINKVCREVSEYEISNTTE